MFFIKTSNYFDLSDEPLDEPLAWMEKIAIKNPSEICFLKVGEVFKL
jgi:hypothetical protein